MFFPIVQFFIMSVQFIYRFVNYSQHNNGKAEGLAKPAAIVNSLSSIIYALIFAFTNGIFTEYEKQTEMELNKNIFMTEFGQVEL